MSEHGNPPVAPESPAVGVAVDESEAPAEAATAAAPPTPETGEVPAPVESPAPAQVAAPAVAAESAAPAQGKKGERKKDDKKRGPRRKPGARAEEYVAPTPEELAGIPNDAIRQSVAEGLPVQGKVIGWNQGGFHVAVEGITSFCPRSSMEIGTPREPAHYLDQVYAFRVLRVEEKGHRLILSRVAMLREEKRHQAEELRRRITVGSELDGKVVALTDFGAFVDLGGVEGLVHVSELRHGRVTHPSEVLAPGQAVRAKVIKLGAGGERISLSLKALEPDPWQGAQEKWATGSKFTGKVMRKSEFGWFVELAPGVEGLLHPSQLPPGMSDSDPSLAVGATLEGWVRELDLGRKRVSLALRETATGNPWEGVEARYPEGAKVTGTIEKIQPFGAFVVLEPGLTGLLPTSEMGLPRGASVGKAYRIGKQVTLQVAQVDVRKKKISLTLEGKTLEGSRSDYQTYLKKTRRGTGLSALAAALERLKSPAS